MNDIPVDKNGDLPDELGQPEAENLILTTYDRCSDEQIHSVSVTSTTKLKENSAEKISSKILSRASGLPLTEEVIHIISKRNPQDSPRIAEQGNNYLLDSAPSAYTLQLALKNMKDRYQKLQRKISVLEEENGRLICGKSELFGEIGKMQESSIKLREKNLQLNHEVHSKHQECCSLREEFSSVSTENLTLTSQLSQSTAEKKNLAKEVERLGKENNQLKIGFEEILSRCKAFPHVNPELLLTIERISSKALMETNTSSVFSDSKVLIPPSELSKCDIEKINGSAEDFVCESFVFDESKDVESLSLDACYKAKESMKKMAAILQRQNQQLQHLKPLALKTWKRKLDSCDLEASGDHGRNFLSRAAVCGSGRHLSAINLSSDERIESCILDDSGGETNVLVEEIEETGNKNVPFDWRKVDVQVSVDESSSRPETRSVSTSPVTLTFGLSDRELSSGEEDRTCPMCNAVFPLLLPQETFESHVVSHFEVENGFEVIT